MLIILGITEKMKAWVPIIAKLGVNFLSCSCPSACAYCWHAATHCTAVVGFFWSDGSSMKPPALFLIFLTIGTEWRYCNQWQFVINGIDSIFTQSEIVLFSDWRYPTSFGILYLFCANDWMNAWPRGRVLAKLNLLWAPRTHHPTTSRSPGSPDRFGSKV